MNVTYSIKSIYNEEKMIAIVNKGKSENAKREDERMYEVRINAKTLFCFTHNREDGLAACLSRAANAAFQYEQLTKITRGFDEPVV